MARWWIRVGNRRYCHRGIFSTCFRSRLRDSSDADRHIRAATKQINGILSTLERQYAGQDRRLAFLAVSDGAEDDILTLDWIYLDEEIATSYDGMLKNQIASMSAEG